MKSIVKLAAAMIVAAGDVCAEDRGPVQSRNPQQKNQQRIVVSILDRKLMLFDGEQIVKTYDVAVGKPSTPTPQGEFRIINQIVSPTYFGHGVVVPPGAENPLGTRWMGLSISGYGIHGTNVPTSIGRAASHGCVRMRQQDLEELFALVRVGALVELRSESLDALSKIFATQVIATKAFSANAVN